VLGTLAIAPTEEAAQAKMAPMRERGVPEERIASFMIAGDVLARAIR
jgi:hypothetical protein